MINQMAAAMGEFLTTGMNNSSDLMDDLKLLAGWVRDIGPWTPGNFAIAAMDAAIEEYGADCGNLRDDLVEHLSTHNIQSLKDWIGYTFNDGELLMLDIVLWNARGKAKE